MQAAFTEGVQDAGGACHRRIVDHHHQVILVGPVPHRDDSLIQADILFKHVERGIVDVLVEVDDDIVQGLCS